MGKHIILQKMYDQENFSTFIYGKDKKLTPYKKEIMPPTDENKFLKQGIPDTVKKKILANSNMTFDLSNKQIMLSINSQSFTNDEIVRKWLKGDRIYYDWIKDYFIPNKVGFQ